MSELQTGRVQDAGTTTGTEAVVDPEETVRTTAARDRAFAKRIGEAALAWALIWSVIIAALFLFGDAISALVV